jgi:hypothetical protein
MTELPRGEIQSTSELVDVRLSTDTSNFVFIFAELAGRGGRITERGLPVFA